MTQVKSQSNSMVLGTSRLSADNYLFVCELYHAKKITIEEFYFMAFGVTN